MNRIVTVLVLTALIICTPLFLRALDGAPISPGTESYSSLRDAELLSRGELVDPISSERVRVTPHLLLLTAAVLAGIPWALPPLLMISLLGLSFLLVRRFEHERVAILSIAVFAISPSALYLGTGHDPRVLAMLFGIAGLLVRMRWARMILFALSAATILPVGIVFATASVLVGRDLRAAMFEAFIAIVAGGAWAVLAPTPLRHTGMFFELGTPGGLSLFFLIVAGYGLMVMRKNPQMLLSAAILLVCTIFLTPLIPVLVLFASILIGHALASLISEEWDLDLLRQSFLILIVCAGLFLLITGVRERSSAMPDHEISDMLVSIGASHREGAILAEPDYAPLIVYFAHRKATLGSSASNEFRESFASSPDETYDLLESTGTRFVVISPRVTEEIGDDVGIMLLLQTRRFVKLQEGGSNTAWYYIPRVTA